MKISAKSAVRITALWKVAGTVGDGVEPVQVTGPGGFGGLRGPWVV
ncbi:MAG: hypothetical protein ACRD4E_18030 [Bryobacteraceae bacterium]